MKFLTTPESSFDNLPDYPFSPNYVEVENLIVLRKNSILSSVDYCLHYLYCVCYCLFFLDQLTEVHRNEYNTYLDPTFCHGNKIYSCNKCKSSVKNKKTPKFARSEGIKFPTVPPELKIPHLEEQLISLRVPFMKLIVLPIQMILQTYH